MMKHKISTAILLLAGFFPVSLHAQYTKPVYISLPGPGNIQHLAYVVGKEKKFYEEMGIANAQIVVLRGNAINVQALVSAPSIFPQHSVRPCRRCFAANS
jgi:ABC-type nitrate/sulfonate/bicarbonate transport system substrate-binding protein